jgi:hypothetical protein
MASAQKGCVTRLQKEYKSLLRVSDTSDNSSSSNSNSSRFNTSACLLSYHDRSSPTETFVLEHSDSFHATIALVVVLAAAAAAMLKLRTGSSAQGTSWNIKAPCMLCYAGPEYSISILEHICFAVHGGDATTAQAEVSCLPLLLQATHVLW